MIRRAASALCRFVVIVPVHNEAELLGECLRSLAAAASATDVPTLVVPVFDRCTDASVRVAEEAALSLPQMTVHPAHGVFPHIGAVRNAGLMEAGAHVADLPAHGIWTAHTDADSVVPRHWLARHAELAAAGMDLVIGTVEPDEGTASPAGELWFAQHRLGEGHTAVFGANLGVRMDRLLDVGGFSPLQVGEDVDTVRRLQATGCPWLATDTHRVRTSARRTGRAAGGFADFMRGLDAAVSGS